MLPLIQWILPLNPSWISQTVLFCDPVPFPGLFIMLSQKSHPMKNKALCREGACLHFRKLKLPKSPPPTLPKADDSPVPNSDTETDSDLVTSATAQPHPWRKAPVRPSSSFMEVPLHHNQLAKSVVFVVSACAREFAQFSIYQKTNGVAAPNTAVPEQCSEVSLGHTAESFWTWPAFHKGNSYLPQESKNQRPRNWWYLLPSPAN